jgi:hypothetical protein
MENGKVTGLPTTCMPFDNQHICLNRTRLARHSAQRHKGGARRAEDSRGAECHAVLSQSVHHTRSTPSQALGILEKISNELT